MTVNEVDDHSIMTLSRRCNRRSAQLTYYDIAQAHKIHCRHSRPSGATAEMLLLCIRPLSPLEWSSDKAPDLCSSLALSIFSSLLSLPNTNNVISRHSNCSGPERDLHYTCAKSVRGCYTDISRESLLNGQLNLVGSLKGHLSENEVKTAIPGLITNLDNSVVNKEAWY